jgi:anhydro-N-acetylmuramic acid kinase
MERFVGLISGTSGDGIDAAVVLTDGDSARCEIYRCYAFETSLAQRLQQGLSDARGLPPEEIDQLDQALACAFADAALEIIADADLSPTDIAAIGSHGQTLIHDIESNPPRSVQLGDPQRIADRTRIVTVGDFRSADIEAGGQGAPLAPAFHAAVLRDDAARGVLNLGGISNLTVIEPGLPVRGFDIGPANTLLDAWHREHGRGDFDEDGAWAQSGSADPELLLRLLDDPFFAAPPPKSTGRDHFTLAWLRARGVDDLAPADVQATLLALTVETVRDHVDRFAATATEVLVCGGGIHNDWLMRCLAQRLSIPVRSIASLGLDPDAIEASTFAWLAARTIAGLTGNLPEVTGARGAVVLGRILHPM